VTLTLLSSIIASSSLNYKQMPLQQNTPALQALPQVPQFAGL
jgi:hypothetical protein